MSNPTCFDHSPDSQPFRKQLPLGIRKSRIFCYNKFHFSDLHFTFNSAYFKATKIQKSSTVLVEFTSKRAQKKKGGRKTALL